MKSKLYLFLLAFMSQFMALGQPATHLNFGAVNDYIDCGNAPSLQITGTTITLEAYVKFNSFDVGWWKGNIINKHYDFSSDGYMLRAGGNGVVNFIIGNNGQYQINSPDNSVSLNTWHHIAGVYDGVNSKIYVDGVEVASRPLSITIGNTHLNLHLGKDPLYFNRYLDASLENVRIWNIARTATQINTSKNCELNGDETGLVAYYKFNQGVGAQDNSSITTLIDATTNANNGTLTNFTLTGNASNFLVGSPVTTGSIVPPAPIVATQSFCDGDTVRDLIPAPSATNNWYASAANVTALSSTDAIVAGTYYVSAINANGCESERTLVSIVVDGACPNEWTGAADTNWNNGNNWSTTMVPGLTAHAVIKVATNQPIINASTVVDVARLTTEAMTSLNVHGSLKVAVDITNDGAIVFKSDANSTGQFAEFTGSLTGTGEITVERYIPGKRAFRFLSSAVTTSTSINDNWQEGAANALDNPTPGFGTHITGSSTGSNGFDATTTGNATIFGYDNINQAWTTVANTDVNTLTAGTAYRLMVRGSRAVDLTLNTATSDATILRATGSLVTGNVTVSDIGANIGAFNFIGNPYQAAVNMNLVLAASTNIGGSFYYVWDPQLGARGAYTTVMLPAGSNTSTSAANQFVQPGQSMFVTTLANGAGSLLFQEVHKAVGQNTNTFSTPTNNASIVGQLYRRENGAVANTLQDSFGIFFNSTSNTGIDAADAPKIFNQDESIAVQYGTDLLAIDNRQLPSNSESIQLSHNTYRVDGYQYKIEVNAVFGKLVYLEDSYLRTVTLLNDGVNFYDFTVAGSNDSMDSERFLLKIENQTLGIDDNELVMSITMLLNPVTSDIADMVLTGAGFENNSNATIYNLAGQRLLEYQLDFSTGTSQITGLSKLATGAYFLKIESGDISQTIKFMKK